MVSEFRRSERSHTHQTADDEEFSDFGEEHSVLSLGIKGKSRLMLATALCGQNPHLHDLLLDQYFSKCAVQSKCNSFEGMQ